MSLEASRQSFLMSWSAAIFISWCKYFTQPFFVAYRVFTPVKSSDPSFTFQVLGESLCLTTDYLSSEEKVVVANSKFDSIEAESSKLRKDLIEAMDQATKAKEKVKELKDALKVEKKFIIQKDEEVQTVLLKTDEECEKVISK